MTVTTEPLDLREVNDADVYLNDNIVARLTQRPLAADACV
jgi:hypothetical protein